MRLGVGAEVVVGIEVGVGVKGRGGAYCHTVIAAVTVKLR